MEATATTAAEERGRRRKVIALVAGLDLLIQGFHDDLPTETVWRAADRAAHTLTPEQWVELAERVGVRPPSEATMAAVRFATLRRIEILAKWDRLGADYHPNYSPDTDADGTTLAAPVPTPAKRVIRGTIIRFTKPGGKYRTTWRVTNSQAGTFGDEGMWVLEGTRLRADAQGHAGPYPSYDIVKVLPTFEVEVIGIP